MEIKIIIVMKEQDIVISLDDAMKLHNKLDSIFGNKRDYIPNSAPLLPLSTIPQYPNSGE